MMAGGAIAPNLNIPGVNKMAGHFVGRKLGQKTSEHFRKKVIVTFFLVVRCVRGITIDTPYPSVKFLIK
jgi:hypothetical protein